MTPLPGIEDLTREGARRAAQRELLDHRYDDARPPLVVRFAGAVVRRLLHLLDATSSRVPGGGAGLLLLVLLVVGVTVLLVRVRPGRRPAGTPVFGGGPARTADGHRALADQAAGAGDWAGAVRERLRAVVRELEARGVLDPRPGRTAGEVHRDASAAVPALTEPLLRATMTFDEVWYGGRPADASAYAVVVAADQAVTAARLVRASP